MEKLLTLREVEDRLGLKRTAVYAGVKRGEIPAPRRIGPKASRWLESEINEYIANCPVVEELVG